MNCTVKEGDFLIFSYINWKGELCVRKAIVKEFFFGKNEYHMEYQLMIRAFDVDKLAERTFAVKGMNDVRVIEV